MPNIDFNAINPADIPDSLILQHPLVNELADSMNLTNFKIPLIIPNKVLMDEGTWNNHYYSAEAIKNALGQTDWTDREKKSIFLDHEDLKAGEWVGEVDNMRIESKKLIGDLVIHDWPLAIKLMSGKPKFGISPKVRGKTDIKTNEMFDFVFDNFSIVINPAVKTAYINNMEVDKMAEVIESKPTKESELAVKKKEYPEPIAKEEAGCTPEKYPKEKAMDELSAYSDFVKAKRDEGWDFAKIAEAWKTQNKGVDEGEVKNSDSLIAGLEKLLSELRGKKQEMKEMVPNKELSELKDNVQKMQATIEELKSIPDKRSVNVEGTVDTLQAQIKEIQKDSTAAMRKWVHANYGGASYE